MIDAERRLPSFVIIGAAKAATTWIANQLRHRDDVFMPGPEPHYFSREYARGVEHYAALFSPARPDQRVGEKSADYLADPLVPQRMAALIPAARLVAQLRNPVERAYSDYCMLFRRGRIDGDVDRHLDWNRTGAPRFLADGLYSEHLARFLDHYPAEQLKLVLHDDVRSAPTTVIADVCTYLGLEPRVAAPPQQRINDSRAALVPSFLRRLPTPIKNAVAPLRGVAAFEHIRALIARPVAYPPFASDTRKRLADFYHDDINRLGRMIGRDLGDWLEPTATPQ